MASTDPNRPNLLFLLADDMGAWAMHCAGLDDIHTPNLDRLAATGIRFENFFCVSPVCSPARASLLTGRIPSQHGVHDFIRKGNVGPDHGGPAGDKPIEYLQGLPGYTDFLAEAGWDVAMIGKWHLGASSQRQKSCSRWFAHIQTGGDLYYNSPVVDEETFTTCGDGVYFSDAITDRAITHLENGSGNDDPFCLHLHYTAPHSPWDRDHHPHAVWDDYRQNNEFPSMPREPRHPLQVKSAPAPADEEGRRDVWAGYFAAVTEMDRNIGRVLDWLEERNLRENTLIFFTADNGMSLGHHGIFGKGNGTMPINLYDSSVKVPAILSRPGHLPQGQTWEGMFSHYDWLPTLLDYLGLDNPVADECPGQTFAPLLRGEVQPGRDAVVIYDEYGPVRMIRTDRWKYVHRYPYGPHELFNIANDPKERTNLHGDPEHTEILQTLRGRLDHWFDRYVDPDRDGARQAVTGKGQFRMCDPDGDGSPVYATDWKYTDENTPKSAFPTFED